MLGGVARNENFDNKLVEFNGHLGFWRTNKWGNRYFEEVELRGNLYYIKGSEQVYVPHSEYISVMKGISPENISGQQFESKEFSKQINGIWYFVRKTDEGWIIINRIQ